MVMQLASFKVISIFCSTYVYYSTKNYKRHTKQQNKYIDLVFQPTYFTKAITFIFQLVVFLCQLYIMNVKFSKQVDRVNQLLNNSTREEPSIAIDTANLASTCTPRHKASSKLSSPGSRPKYQSQIFLVKQEIPKKYLKILQDLFKAKCESLSIKVNQRNWQQFIKAFLSKNQMGQDDISNQTLNLNDFYLGETCLRQINIILSENPALSIIKFNKNLLNPNNLVRLGTFKELTLCNCKLGNDVLEELFIRLHDSVIEKLCLSSPQVKHRNQLTRYKHLISLIQKSSTIHTLQLSNMDIHPDCMILESCRNTSLRHIDLSDNTNVKGIASSLLSLNLSRNSIVIPFTYPMLLNDLNYLNLSYNKIPIYQLKQFLKITYFNNLRHIVFDHMKLDGELSSIQYFLEQSLTLVRFSLVNCDLSQLGFQNVAHGVKHCKTLEYLDLTYNKVHNEKTAESLAHMIQGGVLKQLKMRHCQIKDNLGAIIFKNIRKVKALQKIDLMNNLLGDNTAKTICSQLKFAKTILGLCLEENIIKYKDIQEINSYLEGNRYFNVYQLDKEYHKLLQINNQIQQANLIINAENEKLAKLEKETEQLEGKYIAKFKVENEEKKSKLKQRIYALRDEQNMLMTDITLMHSLPSMTELNSMQSARQSFIEHPTFTNL